MERRLGSNPRIWVLEPSLTLSRLESFSVVPLNTSILRFSEHLRECTMKTVVCLQTAFSYSKERGKRCLLLTGGKRLGKWRLGAAAWNLWDPSERTPQAGQGRSWQQTPQHRRPAGMAPLSQKSLGTQCRAPCPGWLPAPAGTCREAGRRSGSWASGWAGRGSHRKAAGWPTGRAGAPSACPLLSPGLLL